MVADLSCQYDNNAEPPIATLKYFSMAVRFALWKLQDMQAENNTAERYDYLYNRTHFARGMYSNFASLVKKYAKNGKKNLELGCGTGTVTSLLGGECYSMDFSYNMLQVAKSKCKNILQADMEHLPYSAASFDVVFVHSALHHFPSLSGVVAEVKRVLKPGGYFIIQEPNQHEIAFTERLWYFHRKLRQRGGLKMYSDVQHLEEKPSEHHEPLTMDRVVEQLLREDFYIINKEYRYYLSYLFSTIDSKLVYWITRMLDSHYIKKNDDGYMFAIVASSAIKRD